jgi:hypothetical protein
MGVGEDGHVPQLNVDARINMCQNNPFLHYNNTITPFNTICGLLRNDKLFTNTDMTHDNDK